MFVFDNSEDTDISTYEYKLYTVDQVEQDPLHPGYYQLIDGESINDGTTIPYSQGFNPSNVFAIAVENSTTTSTENVTTPVSYYGAVRAIDTSLNSGDWTLITKTSTDTPLIDEEFIGSLTAAKITAGTIGAHEVVLGGANSIIRSSTYNFENELTTAGWYIRGDGYFSLGGANGITYDNSTVVIGSDVQVTANLAADSISVGGVTKLNINNSIGSGVGGMTIGNPAYNYWYANGNFSLGNATKNITWNGSTLEVKGKITTTEGTIGGFNITGTYIETPYTYSDGVGSGVSNLKVGINGQIYSRVDYSNVFGTSWYKELYLNKWSDSQAIYIIGTGNGYEQRTIINPSFVELRGNIPGTGWISTSITEEYIDTRQVYANYGQNIQGVGYDNGSIVVDNALGIDSNQIETSSGSLYLNSYGGGGVRINGLGTTGYGLTVNGNAAKSSGGTAWATFSDINLKKDVINYEKGLSEILQLRPVTFKYNGKAGTILDDLNVGLIAQEVQEIFPNAVEEFQYSSDTKTDSQTVYETYLSFSFNEVQYALINAVKELSAKVDELESRLI